ncbi:DNA/RNA polymerases superfamily protein [Gossypium australe]|uniref:DNA/RNA polymerases superfamily protein n=1 Tax=Gossypium australe TaxID=47621 RepID=A0A5B6WPL1_9ROSI|nr:DNA/RNA polymerases superfamily protein [Gossypium australe]
MLRGCIIKFRGSWEEHFPLAKFSYNNRFQSSIQMALYEALYGRKCRTPLCWTELGERKILGLEVDRLKATSNRQKSYVALKRKDIEYNVRDQVFLKVLHGKKC